MFIGGCAGSTACGIKIFRIQLLYRFLSNQLKKIIYPRGIFIIKYDNNNIDDKFMSSVISFIFLYIIRYLFFKKSVDEARSFLHLFGEDLCFSFGKSLVVGLTLLSFFVGGMGVDNFLFPSLGSFILINFYLIFFRFNFYLRWMAFFVFFIFFFLEALNLFSKRDREVSFE